MTTYIVTQLARFGDWYDALAWREQTLLGLGLIVVTAAIVFLGVQVFAWVMVRSLRREIREPWHLAPPPRTSRESFCRICHEYRIVTDTVCEHCGTPLLLFSDALDMSAHMAKTFPLPPVKNTAPVLVASRSGRVN